MKRAYVFFAATFLLMSAVGCDPIGSRAEADYDYYDAPILWAHDNNRLLFNRFDRKSGELKALMVFDIRSGRTYSANTSYQAAVSALNPTAKAIVFPVYPPEPDLSEHDQILKYENGRIMICEVPCRKTHRLLRDARYMYSGPVLSNDGKLVAFLRKDRELLIAKRDGTIIARHEVPEDIWRRDLKWRNDDRELAVLSSGGSPIAAVLVKGSTWKSAQWREIRGSLDMGEPDITSSFDLLVYRTEIDENKTIDSFEETYAGEIYSLNLRTGEKTRLTYTNEDESDLLISDDGKWVAYGGGYLLGGPIRVLKVAE